MRKEAEPPAPKLTNSDTERLQAYDWPGNIRELQNVIERAAIFAQTGTLNFDFLRLDSSRSPESVNVPPSAVTPTPTILTQSELKRLERESIAAVLVRANGKISGPRDAAELLGMKATTLASRIKALGLKYDPAQ